MSGLPAPGVIGHDRSARIIDIDSITVSGLGADSLGCIYNSCDHLGLFERGENQQSYNQRRQWFKAQIASNNNTAYEKREGLIRRKQPLNEFGHSEDKEAYHQRRKFYHEVVISKKNEPVVAVARANVQAWRTLVRVVCIMIFALSVWFSTNAFLKEIAKDYQIGKQEATLLTVVVNLGFTFGATVSAILQLPDRISPSHSLLVGCLGCAVANALLASGLPYEMLLVIRFVNGMALAMVYPILMRFTSGWFPQAQRGFALGIVIGSLTVGIALPNLLKALFSDTPWRSVALGTSALALLASLMSLGLSDGPFAQKVPGFSCANIMSILRCSNWKCVTLSYCGHNIELFGGWAWIGAFLESYFAEQNGGEDNESTRNVAFIAAFAIVSCGSIGAAIGGWLADRMGKRRFILLMHLISGITIATLPSAARIMPPFVLLFVASIWGLTVIADSAQYSALLAEVLPDKSLLGTAITLSLALGFISTGVGIYAVPLLFEWGGWDGAFPCLGLGPVCGIIAMLAVRNHLGAKNESK